MTEGGPITGPNWLYVTAIVDDPNKRWAKSWREFFRQIKDIFLHEAAMARGQMSKSPAAKTVACKGRLDAGPSNVNPARFDLYPNIPVAVTFGLVSKVTLSTTLTVDEDYYQRLLNPGGQK